jgi:hypothetical protein
MGENKALVDIGVACNFAQSYNWWVAVMQLILQEERYGNVKINSIRAVGSALPDHNKNNIIGNSVRRMSLTDKNRTEITKGFLEGDADYLFWMDDDTAPPSKAISNLQKAGREFMSGIYFLPSPPYTPIAYKKDDEGLYHPISHNKGTMLQVDSVGMGCALIHRSVYEKIRDGHTVYALPTGALIPVPNDQVKKPIVSKHSRVVKPYIRGGVYHQQVTPQIEDDKRAFPYYQLEYGRTEDHYFCELAANVGIKPWVDTTIVCDHWKMQRINNEDFEKVQQEEEGLL